MKIIPSGQTDSGKTYSLLTSRDKRKREKVIKYFLKEVSFFSLLCVFFFNFLIAVQEKYPNIYLTKPRTSELIACSPKNSLEIFKHLNEAHMLTFSLGLYLVCRDRETFPRKGA